MKTLIQIVLIMVLAISPCFAQARSKRLILKDGSFQAATKWEVAGDRVRYYSAERFMWEEMPNSLVDWPATNKYSKAIAEGNLKKDDKDAPTVAMDAPEPEQPTVAPGLKLPDSGGIYLLDSLNKKPQLVEIVQNGSEINQQRAKNILRAVINPLPTGPTQSVEIKGPRATVQSHTAAPEIFINVNFAPDDNSVQQPVESLPPGFDRFHIVRLQSKKDVRVVGNLKISLLGKIKEQRDLVATRTEKMSGDWVKLKPLEPLTPGEYAVVEMLSEKQMNLYVWDFGVDPNAPANHSVWTPKEPVKSETGTNESPVLTKRK